MLRDALRQESAMSHDAQPARIRTRTTDPDTEETKNNKYAAARECVNSVAGASRPRSGSQPSESSVAARLHALPAQTVPRPGPDRCPSSAHAQAQAGTHPPSGAKLFRHGNYFLPPPWPPLPPCPVQLMTYCQELPLPLSQISTIGPPLWTSSPLRPIAPRAPSSGGILALQNWVDPAKRTWGSVSWAPGRSGWSSALPRIASSWGREP